MKPASALDMTLNCLNRVICPLRWGANDIWLLKHRWTTLSHTHLSIEYCFQKFCQHYLLVEYEVILVCSQQLKKPRQLLWLRRCRQRRQKHSIQNMSTRRRANCPRLRQLRVSENIYVVVCSVKILSQLILWYPFSSVTQKLKVFIHWVITAFNTTCVAPCLSG